MSSNLNFHASARRIAHLSDVHMLDARPSRARSGYSMGHRFLSFGRPLDAVGRRNKLVHALSAARRVGADHVVVSGDLTEIGSPGEFECLGEALHESGIAPERITLVPGNHDLYTSADAWSRALQGPLAAFARDERPGAGTHRRVRRRAHHAARRRALPAGHPVRRLDRGRRARRGAADAPPIPGSRTGRCSWCSTTRPSSVRPRPGSGSTASSAPRASWRSSRRSGTSSSSTGTCTRRSTGSSAAASPACSAPPPSSTTRTPPGCASTTCATAQLQAAGLIAG